MVVYPVLVSVAEIRVTPAGIETGSNLKEIPPVEFEGGFKTVLFFEHPIRRRKDERIKVTIVFFIIYSLLC
jgi:hypothetical protein